jgi:TPR repeat protein
VLFTTMLFTGFVGQSHAGSHPEFWRKAIAEGRRKAGEKLFRVLGYEVDAGSASAANELGILFMEGRVVPMNTKAAAELFQRSSDAGNIGGACNLLSLAHYYHVGDPAAVARALDRIEAASGSDTNGQASFYLGMAYANGEGRIRDSQRALTAYTRACDLGWRDGCVQVAKLRMFGDGIPVDTAATVAALERSHQTGDLMSAYFLATMLRSGNGVPRDEARALELLKKACDGGVKEACQLLQSAGR